MKHRVRHKKKKTGTALHIQSEGKYIFSEGENGKTVKRQNGISSVVKPGFVDKNGHRTTCEARRSISFSDLPEATKQRLAENGSRSSGEYTTDFEAIRVYLAVRIQGIAWARNNLKMFARIHDLRIVFLHSYGEGKTETFVGDIEVPADSVLFCGLIGATDEHREELLRKNWCDEVIIAPQGGFPVIQWDQHNAFGARRKLWKKDSFQISAEKQAEEQFDDEHLGHVSEKMVTYKKDGGKAHYKLLEQQDKMAAEQAERRTK